MPEIHWWQTGFTYSACKSFTKNKNRIQKFKEIGDSRYIYQNELDGYQRGVTLMVYKYFDKKTSDGAVTSEVMLNQELAEELHKPNIRKYTHLLKTIFGVPILLICN